MLREIVAHRPRARRSTRCSSPATCTTPRRRPPMPSSWSSARCWRCATPARGHRDRRQPRPRGHFRRLPAADGRRRHHPGRVGPHGRPTAAWSSFTARSTGERVDVAVLPFLSQRYAVRAAELIAQHPGGERPATTTSMVRDVLANADRRVPRPDAVNLVMAHLTVLGGTFGGGERAAQSIFEYRVPASDLPGRRALRRAGPPAPAADAAGAVPGPLQRGAAGGRLRRAGQHATSSAWSRPPRPRRPRVTDIPITAGRRLRTVHGTVAELSPLRRVVGDDFLRVCVREPARAGLREEVTDALPNALEVRIDPEFAAPVTPPGRPSTAAGPHPGRAVRRVPARRGAVDDPRVEALFAQLHDDGSPVRAGWLMRPVLLDMDGFASFREPTTVDFTDADYFALVGPTGAGQVDGDRRDDVRAVRTVPRWDDRRTVTYALAPTAERGTVRLVFDVARPAVRGRPRAAPGRARRGERQERPAGAAASTRPHRRRSTSRPRSSRPTAGSTAAVEQLLGLTFEHFTTCVVLPQGEFASSCTPSRATGRRPAPAARRSASTSASRGRPTPRLAAADRATLLAEQLGATPTRPTEAEARPTSGWSALEALAERGLGGAPGGCRRRPRRSPGRTTRRAAGGRARPLACAGRNRTGWTALDRAVATPRTAAAAARDRVPRQRRGRRHRRTRSARGRARSRSAGAGPA